MGNRLNKVPGFFKPGLVGVAVLLAASGLQAQILLLDPSTTTGVGPLPTANVPYAVPTTSQWNRGSAGTYGSGSLLYADGTTATGVVAVSDALGNITGGANYSFTSPGTSSAGNTGMSGVFATNPANNGNYGPVATNVNYGGVGTKVSGLALGTYDVYIVTGYTGTTNTVWPGGTASSQHNVWAFSGTNLSTLNTGSFGAANELLENSTAASWVLNDNYAKLTVTLDSLNPYLYIISEGALNDSKRGWLDSVQIVTVPEPSTYALLALGSAALYFLRRRRKS